MTAILRAESFEIIKNVYRTANINAYDFGTVKRALIEYIRTEFAETFNDFTESSEIVMIISAFAYISEIFSYRQDLGFNENFIQTAQLKNNVIRLAEQMFYSPKRNKTCTGLIKITSISVNEDVFTSSGQNLRGVTVLWNDKNNNQWKEHFYLILNKVLQQSIGNVSTSERTTYNGIIFESYQLNNTTTQNGTFSTTASSNGAQYNLEMIPFIFTDDGLEERTPGLGTSINICYLNDGLGDGSQYTGFFFLLKQGNLIKVQNVFTNQPMNVVYGVNGIGINQDDVWVIEQGDVPVIWDTIEKFYDVVDIQQSKTVLIRTLDNDQIELVFGDGTTREIPNGTFDIWYRTSSIGSKIISTKALQNKLHSFTYLTQNGTIGTATLTVSLVESLSNGSETEDLESIRSNAINLYPTMQRMVNGRDITNHFASQQNILACKAINKSFAGDSQYLSLNGSYNTTNIDRYIQGALYVEDVNEVFTYTNINAETLIINYVEPLLQDSNVITALYYQEQMNPMRSMFSRNDSEYDDVLRMVGVPSATYPSPPTPVFPVALYKTTSQDTWLASTRTKNVSTGIISTNTNDVIIIDRLKEDNRFVWKVYVQGKHLSVYTTDISFNVHPNNNIVEKINLLSTNIDAQRTSLLGYNVNLLRDGTFYDNDSISQTNRIPVKYADNNIDGYPDVFSPTGNNIGALFDTTYSLTSYLDGSKYYVDLPFMVIPSMDDILSIAPSATFNYDNTSVNVPTNRIEIVGAVASQTYNIKIRDRVFFENTNGQYKILTGTYNDQVIQYAFNKSSGKIKSFSGRSSYHGIYKKTINNTVLVNPYSSNVIEVYVVTSGFYNDINTWVELKKSYTQPTPPSSFYLQQTYANVLKNKMISDAIILQHAIPKMLFNGVKPIYFKITKKNNISDYELKTKVVEQIKDYFNKSYMMLGDTVDFSSIISRVIHNLGHLMVGMYAVDEFDNIITNVKSYENEFIVCDITNNNLFVSQ